MAYNIIKKTYNAQNDWASQNAEKPYRTARMDLDMWEKHAPDQYANMVAECTNDENENNGTNWHHHYRTWDTFRYDNDNVWPIDKFTKDLVPNNNRPQRPLDVGHLRSDIIKPHNGVFNHALAGPIDVAIRPDGSINVWDHWHTVVYAKLCGITHLRINLIVHEKTLTLEECRSIECDLYHSKNGLSKKSTPEDVFEKSVAVAKAKGATKAVNPDVALNEIYERLLISPTGKNPNFRELNGVKIIRKQRGALIGIYKNTKMADILIADLLKLLRDAFPQGKISGYLLTGIVDFLHRFQNKHDALTINNLSEMFDELTRAGYTMEDFIGTAQNKKGMPAESISLRMASIWSEWMKTSKRATRQVPISTPAALAAYKDVFLELEIKAAFNVKSSNKFDVQCPTCQNMHTVKVDELAAA